jgi:hypothetical protein
MCWLLIIPFMEFVMRPSKAKRAAPEKYTDMRGRV